MACGRDIYKIATNADTIGIEIMDNLRTKKVIIGRTRSFRKEKRYNSLSVNTVENFTPARVEPMTIIASGVVVTPMVENRLTACCGRRISRR